MTKALSYDDVVLVPRYFEGKSRSGLDTTVQLGQYTFESPVIPANMRCVMDTNKSIEFMTNGYFNIRHRFHNLTMYREMESYHFRSYPHYSEPYYYQSISVGVKDNDKAQLFSLAKEEVIFPDFITIDIAHGHSEQALKMIEFIKSLKWAGSVAKPFVIAGNVSTPGAVADLENAGADAIKVGIGPGRACTTYLQTGFMSPMFSTIQECAAVATVPLIADGGCKNNGDIAKALVAGATMVMLGAQFTGCTDSPAATYVPRWNWQNIKAGFKNYREDEYVAPVYFKEYYGSASQYNKGNSRHIEGTKVRIPGNHLTMLQKMDEIQQSLQSAISYAGGTDLSAFNITDYQVIH